ncbi:MAG: hypothetical protein ACI4AL_09170 [Aristaeellaceae bacterium]
MMKLRSTLLLLLCLMLSAAAALGEAQCMYVDLPGDFAPYGGGWGPSEDGSIYVGGGFGTPGQTCGGMVRISLDGSCADVTPEGDRAEGLYGDVIPLGEDSCIAVRSVRTESGYTDYLGRLDAGGALMREDYIPTGREWSGCTPFVSGGDAYVLLENMYAGSEGLGILKLDAA